MRTTLIAFIIFSAHLIYAQSIQFIPNWTQGESKVFLSAQTKTEWKKGIEVSNENYAADYKLTVLENNDLYVKFQIEYEDVAMTQIIETYKELGEQLDDYISTKFVIEYDKRTGNVSVKNWKEVKNYYDENINKLTDLFSEKLGEEGSFLQLMFDPIKELYASKESIEEMVKNEFRYIFYPYNKTLLIEDTLVQIIDSENPFAPGELISTTYKFYAKQIDKHTIQIDVYTIYDLSAFNEMLVQMMTQMADGFGTELSAENMNEIQSMQINQSIKETILYNSSTTWIESYNSEAVTWSDETRAIQKVIIDVQ